MSARCVGLCIVFRNNSYGGILQSYATVQKIEEFGLDYEIIDYRHPSTFKYYLNAIVSTANKTIVYSKIRSLKKRIGEKKNPEFKRNEAIRNRKFNDFRNERFKRFSKPLRDYEELKEYSHKFTDILVGSDQLWLPSGLATGFYNLMFAPEECNKVSYASSFGVSSIPNNQKEKTKHYLERIQHLSVRELTGQKIIMNLTGRDAEVILDPTMILTKKQWDDCINDKVLCDEDYIFCMFLGNNPEHREAVNKLKEATGYKIVALRHLDEYIPSDESFGDIAPYDVGPEEFINYIRHAKCICTDSFHASVFSIIYHKKFITFDRFASGSNSRNSRLDTLFKNIGVSRRFHKDIISEMYAKIDYGDVDRRIELLRSIANKYIYEALDVGSIMIEKKESPNGHIICDSSECTGCSVCEAVCPNTAISIQQDSIGFYKPIIDHDRCINCDYCSRICPVNHKPDTNAPTKAFAFQNTDGVRINSTSGGFFNAIACKVIDEGGVVCGAAFDEDMVLKHVIVSCKEALEPLQRSKYVQSSTTGIYKRIRQFLEKGEKVLFVGVGCQAAALRNYVGHNKNLIIIDLVCYGVPSSGLFQEWIVFLRNKYNKVIDVHFRDKTYGYATPNVRVIFDGGKYIESCRDSNIYTDLFFRHLSIRKSCYHCRFKSIDRCSDITLGDLWSVRKYDQSRDDNKGTTVAFSHTIIGEEICRLLCFKEVNVDEIIKEDARKMVSVVQPADGVKGFWKKYEEDGFLELMNMYTRDTFKAKAKYLLKRTMNAAGISEKWYVLKKHFTN